MYLYVHFISLKLKEVKYNIQMYVPYLIFIGFFCLVKKGLSLQYTNTYLCSTRQHYSLALDGATTQMFRQHYATPESNLCGLKSPVDGTICYTERKVDRQTN